jgi:hypothetical protein
LDFNVAQEIIGLPRLSSTNSSIYDMPVYDLHSFNRNKKQHHGKKVIFSPFAILLHSALPATNSRTMDWDWLGSPVPRLSASPSAGNI